MSTTDADGVAAPAPERARAVGVLAEAEPLLLHGKPIASHALHALCDAHVDVVPADVSWESVLARGVPLVVHDPACPLTPAAFISAVVDQVLASDRVHVGCRPVTDTIKVAVSDRVGSTVDRESLLEVTSPVVLPVSVLAVLGEWPDLSDVAGLAAGLRNEHPVEFVTAPALGRRVDDESDVLLLEAFEELAHGN